MEAKNIQQILLKRAYEEVEVFEEGMNRFRVFTPFMFGDGDHISVVLKKEREQWILSDEGDTLSHLSLLGVSENVLYGTRCDLVNGILEEFNTENRGGELVVRV
ncbi:MAG: DUF1828 domain-containing protein, partial [Leptolyngbyaceae cyanobacterium SM1_4_3]|nr:DUF1828 domain-containing protein [Leptolyngbyaceae cyanobacterium SM1_4_3]